MMTALTMRSWWICLGLLGLWAAGAPLQTPVWAVDTNGFQRVLADACRTGAPGWTVNPAGFEATMTVTAAVLADVNRPTGIDDQLAAFVGDEVRGVTTPVDVNGSKTFFLTVHGNAGSGQAVTFKYYEADTNMVYPVGEGLTFEANAHHGLVSAPL